MVGLVQQQSLPTVESLSLNPPIIESIVAEYALKGIFNDKELMISLFKDNFGKLMVYASTSIPSGKRLESVRTAAKETARRLNLDFEMVRLERASLPIYVYYEENDGDELIPLYCDAGKMSGLEEISGKLRNMMFVLSFHPNHSLLKEMRSELLKLS